MANEGSSCDAMDSFNSFTCTLTVNVIMWGLVCVDWFNSIRFQHAMPCHAATRDIAKGDIEDVRCASMTNASIHGSIPLSFNYETFKYACMIVSCVFCYSIPFRSIPLCDTPHSSLWTHRRKKGGLLQENKRKYPLIGVGEYTPLRVPLSAPHKYIN